MSGIAGIYFRDGQIATIDRAQRMLEAVAYRCPDGISVWASGCTVLGQGILKTSAYSRAELGKPANVNRFVVVGDVRLDNRQDLIGRVQLDFRTTDADISDLDLIRLLRLQYGSSFIDHIDGDFSLAIYDDQEKSICCYRDHFGTRPLYYSISDQHFVFGSDIKAVFASGLVQDEVDPLRLEDFLAGNLSDQVSTFYAHVKRLEPGTFIRMDALGIQHHTYWSIDPDARIDGTDEELISGFRDRFVGAVEKRLDTSHNSACMLSGGLDSSAVVSTGSHLVGGQNIDAYSVTFPYLPERARVRTDETSYVKDVLDKTNVTGVDLRGDTETPLDTLERMIEIQEQPFLVPNAYLDVIALSAVKEAGHRILLTGLEGDLTVSHGDGYLNELGYSGRWSEFVSESKSLAQHTETDHKLFYERYAAPTLQKLAADGKWGAFFDGVRQLRGLAGDSRNKMIWDHVLRPKLRSAYHDLSRSEASEQIDTLRFIRKDYEGRADLLDRIENEARKLETGTTQAEMHIAQLNSGYSSSLLEFAEKNAANWGIDVRHPFFDRRLVEYSVALPGRTKLNGGWPRYILRASMEQILPESVRWRAQKAALGPNFTYLMSKEPEDRLRYLVDTAIAEFPSIIDKTSVNNLLDRRKYATLWRILVLGAWVLEKRS